MRKILAALMIPVVILLGIGIVLLASAGEVRAQEVYHASHQFIKNQAIWLLVSLAAFYLAAFKFDYERWKKTPLLPLLLYIGVALLLMAVFVPGLGTKAKGSYRWLCLAGFRLGQPSELAKVAIVICMSFWLDHVGPRIRNWIPGLVIPTLLLGLFVGLLVLEPDFGATLVVGVLGGSLMFIAGCRILHLGVLGFGGLAAVVPLILMNRNRMARLGAFFGSEGGEHSEARYQLQQSLYSFQNGGPWGVGYTQSIQKYQYLPEAHTDFIFAIGGEEFGIIFSLSVILLFIIFLLAGFMVAFRAKDRFGRYLAFGMTLLLVFQALFNIGVVSGCFPTKGIALPFISYGGTNLVVAMFAVGVIFNVGKKAEQFEGSFREKLARNIPLEI